MTEPEDRYSIEDAYPEWKHPVDPIATRIAPDGRVAVQLVLWHPGHGEPAEKWVQVSGPCGQLAVTLLDAAAVADWRVC
jgi:hypothetical protein